MTTVTIPQKEGVYTPEEAQAFYDAQINERNYAGDEERAAEARKFVKGIVSEWSDKMRPLHRRWRGTNYMLSGNTLEKGGPEDVHIPKLYSQMETLIPRIEASILEKDPWFRIVPRKRADRSVADTLAAYMDWLFDQARIRTLVQPALRDMLVTQCATFYVYWDNRESERWVRTPFREFDKQGRLKRGLKIEKKKIVEYSGPVARLVDPFDQIADPKSTNPQNAVYFGHRAWLTKDEIKRIGKLMGWANLDKLDEGAGQRFGTEQDFYSWTRDPTARYGNNRDQYQQKDGRPEKIEVVFLHSRWELEKGEYTDVRFVVSAGKTVHEIRKNPNDGQFRPYATFRVTKTGHEFYGTGPFDNAVRLNQHADLLHQTMLRGARVAGAPFVFVEDEGDGSLPDSLYRVQPFRIFKGVGNVRFSTVPDSFLRSMPMVLSMLDQEINQTTGVYPINMGQDSGGTATEAITSLNEGNRRSSGIVMGFADGLEQLLELFYKLMQQHSVDDVEFPVLGKRALDMKKTHAMVGPADLLDSVKFDLVGLATMRQNGLKATGLIQAINATMPMIASNPQAIDTVGLTYDIFSELAGVDVANARIRVPTPPENLRSQDEENEGLVQGTEIEVDPDDDHDMHLQNPTFQDLRRRALDPDDPMPFEVRRVVLQHYGQHDMAKAKLEAQQQAMQQRQPMQLPPEAGGQASPETGAASPVAGGLSNAMSQLANEPGGQTPMENPGPASGSKYGKAGRAGRTTNQTENAL